MSALLGFLLDSGIIQQALTIRSCACPPFAEPAWARTREEVFAAAGSKYQMLPHGDLARELDAASGVVGLPCQLTALRQREAGLKVGLFCGINLSWRAMCFLMRKNGVPKDDVVGIDYRAARGGGRFLLRGGRVVEFGSYSWLAYFFPRKACLACCDHTSRHTDVSVGDRRPGLCNVIVRTETGEKWLRAAMAAGVVEAKELTFCAFLEEVTTPLVQKELCGGYGTDPLVGVRGRWVEHIPFAMLRWAGLRIMRRHRRRSRKLLAAVLQDRRNQSGAGGAVR